MHGVCIEPAIVDACADQDRLTDLNVLQAVHALAPLARSLDVALSEVMVAHRNFSFFGSQNTQSFTGHQPLQRPLCFFGQVSVL